MKNPVKEHYQRLRQRSCAELWGEEVAAFDRASARERAEQVAVVRAVGVVFSETGSEAEKEAARHWLRGLLHDPDERVRRYAMTALPKLGAAAGEEAELLGLLAGAASDRERKFLGRTLEKIGGEATLARAGAGRLGHKAAANVARRQAPGVVSLDRVLEDAAGLRIHLRGRVGLEGIVAEEMQSRGGGKFRLVRSGPGLVTVTPAGALRLGDLYALRCFGTAGLELGSAETLDALAAVIAAPGSRRIFEAFTAGPVRYRVEFAAQGHRRGAVRGLADRVYELCPELLNDSREAPWQIDVRQAAGRFFAELTPRLRPDPRFAYRRRDVPAASHPPLAACLARLAGGMEEEVVWDPFCGSGSELAERVLLGGVRQVFGTDRSAEAVAIAGENFAAAGLAAGRTTFAVADFRDFAGVEGLAPGGVSLVVTNPPLGRRVPIPDLRGLIADLCEVAGAVLRPGGRLVFANPVPVEPAGDRFRLEFRQRVDLGGFYCHLEKYVRTEVRASGRAARG